MSANFVSLLRKKEYIVQNVREFPNAKDGDGVVITYNYFSQLPDEFRTDLLADPRGSFERYSTSEWRIVERSLKAWSSVANITFVRSSSQEADLMFGKHNMPYKVNGYAGGLTYHFEKSAMKGADVWLDGKGFVRTPFGRQVVTHEIGHSLGLTHPYAGKGGLTKAEFASSIMSYSLWGEDPYKGSPTKLGIIDTAAIQSIYGPAKKKLGADTYKVGTTKLIWDGGGIDTMSAASAKSKAYIDMNDGSWSWIKKKSGSILSKGQSWLGHFTEIENAVGSKYSDTIRGNELDNSIFGGGGSDKIIGGFGADVLHGGEGNDVFIYESFEDFGAAQRPESIVDMNQGDRIDFRSLGMTFLGQGEKDQLYVEGIANQFYYHAMAKELRFDANGDRIVDYILRVDLSKADTSSLIL